MKTYLLIHILVFVLVAAVAFRLGWFGAGGKQFPDFKSEKVRRQTKTKHLTPARSPLASEANAERGKLSAPPSLRQPQTIIVNGCGRTSRCSSMKA